ncbi:MAG: galactose-1-phosphate uridylyltransferase [Cytophagaceae bacterium]|nr:galactose-1-phosphate uridylyltransferase [Cytophagaceae bacterium]
MPKNWCPFCPGSGKVPEQYELYIYPNDFPALSYFPSVPDIRSSNLYAVEENYGKCEVVLYSSDHSALLYNLPDQHIYNLVNLWAERTIEISKDPRIKYVFVFENRGEEVGVTMPHPHGQIYGYPFLPLKLQVELDSCKEYYEKTGNNMLLEMNKEESHYGKRIITENTSFLSYIPFFTDYPYGVFISCKKKKSTFADFNEDEKMDLACILKDITGAFDMLFDRPFPYMMCVHQGPVNSEEYNQSGEYFNFHIEFYPPLRDANRIKYYASSEMGGWAATNTKAVEDTSEELRQALTKYRSKAKLNLIKS